MLLPELGDRHHHREIDMARQTKLKIAALATTLVATIGIAAAAPATADNAGKTTTYSRIGGEVCC
jgi:hypothetical protein